MNLSLSQIWFLVLFYTKLVYTRYIFYLHSQRSQDRKWITINTIVKVTLLEESYRNCDKISGCCQLYERHTFHGFSPPPPQPSQPPPLLGAEKICYFRGDPKFKE